MTLLERLRDSEVMRDERERDSEVGVHIHERCLIERERRDSEVGAWVCIFMRERERRDSEVGAWVCMGRCCTNPTM